MENLQIRILVLVTDLLLIAAAAGGKSLQLCPTLWDPIDGSPPGSCVPGILQARTLEWVAISFSNACKWKVKVKSLSRVQLLVTPWTADHQAPLSMGFSRQEYWIGVPLPSPCYWLLFPNYSMVNDHFVLWPRRPHELQFNSLHILSFTDESLINWLGFSFSTFTLERCWSPDPHFSLNSCVSFLIPSHIPLSETLLVELVSTVNITW